MPSAVLTCRVEMPDDRCLSGIVCVKINVGKIRMPGNGMDVLFRKLRIGTQKMETKDNAGKIAVCLIL